MTFTIGDGMMESKGGFQMPIHDWTRVNAGTWHDFHLSWMAELRNAINDGRLPDDYYAQAEQIIGPFGPDVLRLQETDAADAIPKSEDVPDSLQDGCVAVAMRPPQTRWHRDPHGIHEAI